MARLLLRRFPAPFLFERGLVILVLLARLGNFPHVVRRMIADQIVFIAERAGHLGEGRMQRSPRLAAKHVGHRGDRETGQHREIALLDVLLLPERAEAVALRVLVDKIVRSCQPQRSGVMSGSRMSISSLSHSSAPMMVMRQMRCVSSLLPSSSRLFSF